MNDQQNTQQPEQDDGDLTGVAGPLPEHGWDEVPAAKSPTAGMTLAQRILHVGGRINAAGYVEFGSTQAVDALIGHVLRDLPAHQQPVQGGGDARISATTAHNLLTIAGWHARILSDGVRATRGELQKFVYYRDTACNVFGADVAAIIALPPAQPAPQHDEAVIESIAIRIGFGRVQQIAGELWDRLHNCAPRGRMGVTIKDESASPIQGVDQPTPEPAAICQEARNRAACILSAAVDNAPTMANPEVVEDMRRLVDTLRTDARELLALAIPPAQPAPQAQGVARINADKHALSNLRRVLQGWHERAVALGADGVNHVLHAAEVGKKRGDLRTVDGFIRDWKFPSPVAQPEALPSLSRSVESDRQAELTRTDEPQAEPVALQDLDIEREAHDAWIKREWSHDPYASNSLDGWLARACWRGNEVGPSWMPTPENINALPEPVRKYIHDLVANCDPAGMVADNTIRTDQVRELSAINRMLRDKLGYRADPQSWKDNEVQ